MRLGVVQQRADVVFLVTRCFGVFVVVIKTLDVGKKVRRKCSVRAARHAGGAAWGRSATCHRLMPISITDNTLKNETSFLIRIQL